MSKFKRATVIFLICLVVANFWLFAAAETPEHVRGYSNSATIFVKGHYAYVIHIPQTLTLDSTWLQVIDIKDPNHIGTCHSRYIQAAREVFVAGDYLYVARQQSSFEEVILQQYDITNPCSPRLINSFNSGVNCLWITDMYGTDEKIYISMDYSGILVFDVANSSFDLIDVPGLGSPQGIHVRGCDAYVATEALNLWIHDICSGADYVKDTTDWSRDVYNVGSTTAQGNLTYEAADGCFRVWETTDPTKISFVGSNNRGGPLYQVVHVTGDWVYRLGSDNQVEVYKVKNGPPELYTSYTAPGQIYDIHEVHECYWRGPAVPIYGRAHIYGVYENADTVAIWIYSPSWRVQPVTRYKYGDVNKDGIVNISDVVGLINYLSIRGPIASLDAADVNCDGEVNTYDIGYLINYLFKQGPLPGVDCDFYQSP